MRILKSRQDVNSNAGLLLTKCTLDRVHAFREFNLVQRSPLSAVCQRYTNEAAVKSMVCLLSLGKTSFQDVAAHQSDTIFADAVGHAPPSEATMRQRLEMLAGSTDFHAVVDRANLEVLRRAGAFGDVEVPSGAYTPLDCDVSVLVNDGSSKEGVGFTYHGVDGYAPIFATLGTSGYQLANELRPGTQHSQRGFAPFLRRSVGLAARLTDRRLLLRVDSAHDADETLAACFALDDGLARGESRAPGLSFIVKRNPRGEEARAWTSLAEACRDRPSRAWRDAAAGADVAVWRGVSAHRRTPSTADRPLFCVWEVVETRRDGELVPTQEVSTWWTNLPDDADTVVDLYHAHATHEQFHAELKTDLDVERLPSGKFRVNALVLALAAVAFNALRLTGQTFLAAGGGGDGRGRVRIRTVLLRLVYVGAVVGSHAGERLLRLGRNCAVADVFAETWRRLSA